MRRKEKSIEGIGAIEAVVRQARICRLGLCDDGQPYVVPMCFGYEGGKLYFHCATEGRKLDILRTNDKVCFEIDIDCEIIEAEQACEFGFRYQSVIGFGKGSIVDEAQAKCRGLDVIMRQYKDGEFSFSPDAVDRIVIIEVEIESMTGKQSGM
jgi:uncharacterized protein